MRLYIKSVFLVPPVVVRTLATDFFAASSICDQTQRSLGVVDG